MKQVISIQSQVVHGHVGNSAAVFPMQAQGIEVAAVPTVILSNHPRYPTRHGQTLGADLITGLLQGVEERGLIHEGTVVLSGYLGSPANAEVVCDFVARAKAKVPSLTYVCDPVIGDDDSGVFVAAGLVELFRDRLVPMASVITPNHFELGLLANQPVGTAAQLSSAARSVMTRGAGAVVATGCVLDDTPAGTIETILVTEDDIFRTAIPRLPIRPCGTGDLLAGLIVANLVNGAVLPEAVSRATHRISAVLERTQAAGSEEMRLIESFAAS